MRRYAMGLTLIACLVSHKGSAQTFDRQAWLDDYSFLKESLERRYSNLAWFGSPEGGVDLPALDRRTLAALKIAQTDDDARSAIVSFVRGFGDGHFSQLASVQPPLPGNAPNPPSPEYSRDDPLSGCTALNYGPYDRPQFSLPFESLPGFKLLADGIRTPFRAGVIGGGGSARVGIVRIPSFEELADLGLCLATWSRDVVWDAKGKLVRASLRNIVEQEWYRTLAAILHAFSSERVDVVIVDVGNNSGGDDSGDIAARLFTAKPLRSSRLLMTQDSATSVGYFDEQLEVLREAQKIDSTNDLVRNQYAFFSTQKKLLNRNDCTMEWAWRERRAWSSSCRRLIAAGSAGGPIDYMTRSATSDSAVARSLHWPTVIMPLWGTWRGPLYVLTDNRTYSAAEMFAAVLRNNDAAKIVGVRTGGDGCGFMSNPAPVILPHSKLRFRVPNCVRLRADGSDEVAGVSPDIPVLPTEGESGRARALRIVDVIRKDLVK